ncbi:MAG: DUF721 domain-containing protein [Alphaproteobacteria bacterium]|nr:DUF721 domain-containing protein [Alphaproteobacteria bacterium]
MAYESKSRQPEEPPPRRNRGEAISRCTAPLVSGSFARAGFPDPALVLRWTEIVGPQVARLCQPIKFRESPSGGVLTLKAEPGASLFLQHQGQTLCEQINLWFGRKAIAHLRFLQGSLAGRDRLARPSRKPGNLKENEPALDFRGSDRVREALIKLARQRTRHRRPD